MSRVPLVWRLLLRRSARQLGARLGDGEALRAVGVACHHRSSGGLAVVDAFARGSGVGLLALSGKRLLFVGHGGWLEPPRETLPDAQERQERLRPRALRLPTTARRSALDRVGGAPAAP